jgi:hypothetical protein
MTTKNVKGIVLSVPFYATILAGRGLGATPAGARHFNLGAGH